MFAHSPFKSAISRNTRTQSKSSYNNNPSKDVNSKISQPIHKDMHTIDVASSRLPHSQTAFYHYSDSMYMGEMRDFKRNGKGILLHDNGLAGIIQSAHGRLKGHNVFIGENSILSIVYRKNDTIEKVYRKGKDILILNYFLRDGKPIIDSPGYLIQFQEKLVSELKFYSSSKDNRLKQKTLLSIQNSKHIIEDHNLSKILKEQHVAALTLRNMKMPTNIKVFEDKYTSSNLLLHLGYCKAIEPTSFTSVYKSQIGNSNLRTYEPDGLGIVLQVYQNRHDPYLWQFKIKERGFYKNQKLQYFGEVHIEGSRNYYFGHMKEGQMHGKGILVYGDQQMCNQAIFDNGQAVKVDVPIDFNSSKGYKQLLSLKRKLHSENSELWINQQFDEIPIESYLVDRMDQCKSFSPTQDQESLIQQSKIQSQQLSRVIQDFKKGGNSRIKAPIDNTKYYNSRKETNNRQTQQYSMERQIHEKNLQNFYQSKMSFGERNKQQKHSPQQDDDLMQSRSIVDKFMETQRKGQIDSPQSLIKQLNNNQRPSILKASRQSKSSQRSKGRSHSKERFGLKQNQQESAEKRKSKYEYLEQSQQPIAYRHYQNQVKSRISSNNLDKYRKPQTSVIGTLYNTKRAPIVRNSPIKHSIKHQGNNHNTGSKTFIGVDHILKQVQMKPINKVNKYSDYSNFMYPMVQFLTKSNSKYNSAVIQSVRLSNSNKQKQQLYHHYDHYTHRKHFNYREDNQFQANPVFSRDSKSRSPYKLAQSRQKKNHYTSGNMNRSVTTTSPIKNLVNRIYPHTDSRTKYNDYQSKGKLQSRYDSRYQQQAPLGSLGAYKYTSKQSDDNYHPKNIYGKDIHSSIIKNNIIIPSQNKHYH